MRRNVLKLAAAIGLLLATTQIPAAAAPPACSCFLCSQYSGSCVWGTRTVPCGFYLGNFC